MTLNDTAAHYLQTYAAGGEVEGGWLFGKALQQTQLDFSPESLGRLDHMLAQIRIRAKPTPELLESTRGINFQSLVAFYMIELARRRTGADIAWHDRASALRVLAAGTQLPATAFTRLLAYATDHAAIFLPLRWIETQMLPDNKIITGSDYLASVVTELGRHGPPAWWQAAHAMGRVASWQMMTAADGRAVLPLMMDERAPRSWTTLTGGVSRKEEIDEAIGRGRRNLDENPEGRAWQVLCHDDILGEGREKGYAVTVVARTYGDNPLQLTMAFPYRPKRGGRPLVILKPILRGTNVPPETIARLDESLKRGIHAVKWIYGSSWDESRESEGRSRPMPLPRPTAPPPPPAWAAPAPARDKRPEPAPEKKKGWKPW